MKKYWLYNIALGEATRGWVCDLTYRVETHRQSTRETCSSRGYGKSGTLGLITAYLVAHKNMHEMIRQLREIPGEFHNCAEY